MELDGIVKRSESKNQQKHTSTMAATMSSNYWTATAFYTMFQQHKEEEEGSTKYTHDDCGVKCFVTADAPNDFTPLEPHCANCGYPPHICDPYWTKCARTKIGRWFDEAQDRWIEAEPIMTQEQKEALDRWIGAEPITTQEQKGAHDRWSQHKYGLCLGCKVGLDDKADFTFNYSFSSEHGTMMCHACNEKLNQQFQKYCTNCFNAVNEGDVVIGSLHPISKQRVVTFCRRC